MSLQHKIEPGVERIARKLVDSGFEAYVVGGAVRDLLLDIPPKDYDLATSATPEQIRQVFGRRRARIIGRRFRLVHVYTEKGYYEVSTFRREPSPEERCSRADDNGVMLWRDNQYGTLKEDAFRRDFTVNAIFFDPVGKRGIVDFTGGVQDIKDGVVRGIGNPERRLEEDPVRLLRALKLVAQYGFSLDPALEHALRPRVGQIRLASNARLFEELLKILSRPFSYRTFEVCREYGLLQHYWPNLSGTWDTPRGRVTTRLLAERDRRMATGQYSTSRALALATVSFADVAKALGSPGPTELWEHGEGVETMCRDAVREFFHPFAVSRFFSARVRDILLMLPRFKQPPVGRILRHPEYKYGRELFSLLTTVCDWADDGLARWPPHDPAAHGGRRHRGRQHPQRRRPYGEASPPATQPAP